jgi:hypothetical protein
MDPSAKDNNDTFLDILGIARIPITVKKGECVKQLKARLCFAPNLRVLHDGQLLTDSALVPAGSSILVAPGVVGGGDDNVINDSSEPFPLSQSLPLDTAQPPKPQTDDALLGSSVKSTASSTGSRTRCHTPGCEDRPAKIVGDCRYCQGRFCSRHRLPEAHQCDQLEHCRQQSLAKNTDKLLSGKCVADKM